MVMCRVAKKVVRNTSVLFMRTKILSTSTSHILKTTEPISTKFIYFMLYIYVPYQAINVYIGLPVCHDTFLTYVLLMSQDLDTLDIVQD